MIWILLHCAKNVCHAWCACLCRKAESAVLLFTFKDCKPIQSIQKPIQNGLNATLWCKSFLLPGKRPKSYPWSESDICDLWWFIHSLSTGRGQSPSLRWFLSTRLPPSPSGTSSPPAARSCGLRKSSSRSSPRCRFGEDTYEMYLRYEYMKGCIF